MFVGLICSCDARYVKMTDWNLSVLCWMEIPYVFCRPLSPPLCESSSKPPFLLTCGISRFQYIVVLCNHSRFRWWSQQDSDRRSQPITNRLGRSNVGHRCSGECIKRSECMWPFCSINNSFYQQFISLTKIPWSVLKVLGTTLAAFDVWSSRK